MGMRRVVKRETSLPRSVERIRSEADAFRALGPDIEMTFERWGAQAERIRRAVPEALLEDSGETIRHGELSPGCRACKAGRWDCLFGSMSCNLTCAFCLTPGRAAGDLMWSALGDDPEELAREYERCDVAGASISGGEPFLEPERVLDMVAALRRIRPSLYIWAYTNGLLLTSGLVSALADAGLDELRFNLAATGYNHPEVNRLLRIAVDRLPAVAVEIPAIPDDEDTVLTALPLWSDAGVRYLNLHDLIYEPGSPSGEMRGEREPVTMPDGHSCGFDPRSGNMVMRVLSRTIRDALPLAINYCSLASKARQLRGRRRMMAGYVLEPHEVLLEDGTAESACWFDERDVQFAHPSSLDGVRHREPFRGAALVRRLLPLSPDQPGRWVHFEDRRKGPGPP